ncbi:MAG: hypothetical protein ACRD3W_13965, partial [Terriglobales bacterium]
MLARTHVPIDQHKTMSAIQDIYESVGFPPPMIFWCKSPWQVALMPIALQILLRSDSLWRSRSTFENLSCSMQGRHLWRTLALHFARNRSNNAPLSLSEIRVSRSVDAILEDKV